MNYRSRVLHKVLLAFGVAAAIGVAGSVIPRRATGTSTMNRPLLGDARIDPETLAIVERACQNCHSERTDWPWYSRVPPISLLIAHDVEQATSHMNLSRWPDYSPDNRLALLSAIGSAVRNGKMPVWRYILLHPEARLTDEERQRIYQWTRNERSRLKSRATQTTSIPQFPHGEMKE